jgi:hypothetical protein
MCVCVSVPVCLCVDMGVGACVGVCACVPVWVQDEQRARHLTAAQVAKLEDLWKEKPEAQVEDIDKPGEEAEVPHVLSRCARTHPYTHSSIHAHACIERERRTRLLHQSLSPSGGVDFSCTVYRR